MASKTVNKAFNSIADLKTWYNNKSGGNVMLSDIPEIIPLRWTYFRDNWEFIRDTLASLADNYEFPDLLREQIADLTSLIDKQKNNQNQKINPFSNSSIVSRFYAVWDNINAAEIALTKQEQAILKDKNNRINRFIRTDFQEIRNNLTAARDEIADTVGLSDSDYNSTVGRNSVNALKSPKISDIVQMQTFQSAIKSVNFIIANSSKLSTVSVDPFALARLNANNPEILIASANSNRLVRMRFGDNLQTLANQYLGDSNRWIEIAIANGLRSPYIDEIGEAIFLLSNGEDNKLNLSETTNGSPTQDKVYINQPVFLSSSTVKFPEQRTIISITTVPISGEIVLELSGESDLDKFKTNENAVIRVYKPNTVNSNFFVAIPSPQLPGEGKIGETPFFLEASSEDEKRAGIDLLFDDNGDIVLGSNGDLQLNYGVANAVQAIKLKMLSEKGQSKRHPTYGLPSVQGEKERDPEFIKQMLVDGINSMVSADSRFDRIEQIDIRKGDVNDIRIGIVVRMAGSGTLVPLSFTLNVN
jgi:hypothetical protein